MSEFEIHEPHQGVEVAFENESENIGKILVIGILSLVLFVASLFMLDDYFSIKREAEILNMDLGVPSEQLKAMRDKENSTLSSYKLLDADKAVYRIPIDRAMRLIAVDAFENEVGD